MTKNSNDIYRHVTFVVKYTLPKKFKIT